MILGNSFASKQQQQQQEMDEKDELFSERDTVIFYKQLFVPRRHGKRFVPILSIFYFNYDPHHIIPCIFFLCRHKLCIGTLMFNSESNDIIRLLEQLFTTCDTSKLTYMKALRRSNNTADRNDKPITTLKWVSACLLQELPQSTRFV